MNLSFLGVPRTGRVTRRAVVAAGAAAPTVLAACEAGSGSGSSTATSLVAQPTKIELWVGTLPNAPEGAGFNDLLARIRQMSPNLTVNADVQPGGAALDKILANVAAGTPPDVSGTYVAQTSVLGARQVAEPLAPLLKSAKDWSLNDYFDGPRDAFTYKGELILAPMIFSPRGMAINLDLLGRAGLAAPPANWTWDTFTQYAVKLTRREGSEVKVYGAATPTDASFGTCDFFGSALWSFGGDWVDRAKTALTFHRPEGIAALEMWVNLALKQQAAPTVQPESWRGLPEGGPFRNGLAAIAYVFSSDPAIRGAGGPLGFPWTTAQMPRQKQGGSHFFAYGWYILKAAKEKAGAAEFIRLASLPESIVRWNVAAFGMVTRKAAASQKDWQEHLKAQPLLAPFSASQSYSRSYPAIAGWQDAMFATGGVGRAVADAREGKAGPKPALEEAARVMEGILAQQPK